MHIVLNIILAVQMLSAITMVGLILIQHGKGADMGAAFGSGASGSLLGATGSANFLSRTTAVLAAIFFLTSLGLAYLATHRPKVSAGVMETEQRPTPPPAPVQIGPAKAPAAAGDTSSKSGEGAASRANEVPK